MAAASLTSSVGSNISHTEQTVANNQLEELRKKANVRFCLAECCAALLCPISCALDILCIPFCCCYSRRAKPIQNRCDVICNALSQHSWCQSTPLCSEDKFYWCDYWEAPRLTQEEAVLFPFERQEMAVFISQATQTSTETQSASNETTLCLFSPQRHLSSLPQTCCSDSEYYPGMRPGYYDERWGRNGSYVRATLLRAQLDNLLSRPRPRPQAEDRS